MPPPPPAGPPRPSAELTLALPSESEIDTPVSLGTIDVEALISGAPPPSASPVSAPDPASRPVGLIAGRYEDLGLLGQGGIGEVRRVRDVVLNRTLAMKIILGPITTRRSLLARFLEEAQATAQLQHPNIVPVHDLGTLPDGRPWFTMGEVRGRTLREILLEVHAVSRERWSPAPSGWTFRRLIGAFLTVCQAVGFAHQRGVVHRDIKPANIMLAARGEVYVLDWGLARILGGPHRAENIDSEWIQTDRSASDSDRTRTGEVAGTPAYMPPEQARGALDRDYARSDVYALGATLYEILSGRPPYVGDARSVLAQLLLRPPAPVGRSEAAVTFCLEDDDEPPPDGPPLPAELVAACERAMARDPGRRFPSASALADEIQAWLEGTRLRERGLEVVAQARQAELEAGALMARARELRTEGRALLRGVERWRPEEDKAPGWARLDAAEEAERAARRKQLEVDQILNIALQVAPDLLEARELLLERHRARFVEAEASRAPDVAADHELLLRGHAGALPESSPLRREVFTLLRGDGALTLLTDPPGAEVLLYRYERHNRRLVEVFERSLGPTPLRGSPLPMGSYLAVLRLAGREEVRYPFEITRLGHWDGLAPGERAPEPVWLPPVGWLGPDEIYLPAGWFHAGGDPAAASSLPAERLWCPALVMHRFPITNVRYIRFLNDLVQQGREGEALTHAPRERAGVEGAMGALIYGYEDGRFSLRPDADGDLWGEDWPVFQVDWLGARAWLDWLAAATGRPWRLPHELEWERAARGADGRCFPWGDHLDPAWCCSGESHAGRPLPTGVGAFPVDVSPHGVRGLGGGIRDWCLNRLDGARSVVAGRVVVPEVPPGLADGGLRAIRGGAWDSAASQMRSACRLKNLPLFRDSSIGFRGVCAVGGVAGG